MMPFRRLLFCSIVAILACGSRGFAQSAGTDETIISGGATSPNLALTDAQESALYRAAARQRTRTPNTALPVAVGAPVPPSLLLLDLPDQAALGDPAARLLKYAMVDNDVVVVDPIKMRVVDIIRRNGTP
jgi:hypothetical protein